MVKRVHQRQERVHHRFPGVREYNCTFVKQLKTIPNVVVDFFFFSFQKSTVLSQRPAWDGGADVQAPTVAEDILPGRRISKDNVAIPGTIFRLSRRKKSQCGICKYNPIFFVHVCENQCCRSTTLMTTKLLELLFHPYLIQILLGHWIRRIQAVENCFPERKN